MYRSYFLGFAAFVISIVSVTPSYAEDRNHFIGVGYHAATIDYSEIKVFNISYEYKINPDLGLQINYVDFEYEYEDDEDLPYYEFEKGEGFSLELLAIYYPSDTGLFVGGGIGGGNVDYDYIEIDGGTESDSGTSFGYETFVRLGYQFIAGPVFLSPQIQIGKWFDVGETADIYGSLGVSLGMHL